MEIQCCHGYSRFGGIRWLFPCKRAGNRCLWSRSCKKITYLYMCGRKWSIRTPGSMSMMIFFGSAAMYQVLRFWAEKCRKYEQKLGSKRVIKKKLLLEQKFWFWNHFSTVGARRSSLRSNKIPQQEVISGYGESKEKGKREKREREEEDDLFCIFLFFIF